MKASILFLAYNQERFVGAAIRSAMAQDYPHLELVVCDDGSTDKTRAVLEAELMHCPPHIAVVRAHADRNVGLIANFNRGMAACSGEVVVPMAGDDVSVPSRVSRLVGEFQGHPRRMVVFSNWRRIDAEGNLLPGSVKHSADAVFRYDEGTTDVYAGAAVCGATAAYRAALATTFGPMVKGHHPEDRCYWIRGLILGEVRYVSEPLVFWRRHDANISNFVRRAATPEARAKMTRAMLYSQHHGLQFAKDIRLALDRRIIAPELAARLFTWLAIAREQRRLRRYSLTVAPWRMWIASARRLLGLDRSRRTISRVLSDAGVRLSATRRNTKWSQLLAANTPDPLHGRERR